jgi:hypothetical protein
VEEPTSTVWVKFPAGCAVMLLEGIALLGWLKVQMGSIPIWDNAAEAEKGSC